MPGSQATSTLRTSCPSRPASLNNQTPHCPATPQVNHEDFNEAITEVQAKKKASLNYYA